MWFSDPGQCTAGIRDYLYQWQTLIAGVFAALVAVVGVGVTFWIERRRFRSVTGDGATKS
jgi:hypothetical protein